MGRYNVVASRIQMIQEREDPYGVSRRRPKMILKSVMITTNDDPSETFKWDPSKSISQNKNAQISKT